MPYPITALADLEEEEPVDFAVPLVGVLPKPFDCVLEG
jgi:hypothetical protein